MITSGEKSVECWPASSWRAGERAFTLVELLAIFVILLIISFLVFPTLVRGKQKATQTNCQSNLRQIGLALQIYADANRESLPGPAFALANPAYDSSSTNQLAWFLAEGLGCPRPSTKAGIVPALLCPAQRLGGADPAMVNGDAGYMLNQGRDPAQTLPGPPFGHPGSPVLTALKLSTVATSAPPAICFALADADKGNVNATLTGWNRLPYQPVHGKVRNQLFFDWHVAAKCW